MCKYISNSETCQQSLYNPALWHLIPVLIWDKKVKSKGLERTAQWSPAPVLTAH